MKFKYLVLAFLLSASFAFSTETFDKIYMKNSTARGGTENVNAAQSFIIDGELVREDSIKFTFRVAYRMPNSMIVEYYQEADTIAFGFDGKTAWTLMPSLTNNAIELPTTSAEEAISLTVKPIIEYYSKLDYFKKIKAKVQVSDKDTLDSIPQFKLICPLPGDDGADVILVNQTDYQIAQINTGFLVGGKLLPAAIKLGDYRKTANVVMPFSVNVFNGKNSIVKLKISSIEVNPELKDEIFLMPR